MTPVEMDALRRLRGIQVGDRVRYVCDPARPPDHLFTGVGAVGTVIGTAMENLFEVLCEEPVWIGNGSVPLSIRPFGGRLFLSSADHLELIEFSPEEP